MCVINSSKSDYVNKVSTQIIFRKFFNGNYDKQTVFYDQPTK